MKWFYAQGQQQAGPVDEAEFERLIQAGAIRPDTLVWREGMTGWQPLASVRGPAPAPPPFQPPGYPAPAPQQQYQPPYQGVYAPQAGQTYGAASGSGFRYAGFWIRFLARVIDGVILFIVNLFLRLPLGLMLGLGAGFGFGRPRLGPAFLGPAMFGLIGASTLIGLGVGIAYEVYFVSTRGATPGKMALGLKIIQADGSPLPAGLALGRYLASWLSAFVLFIGYIIAAFDSQKRALHDHICNTRVIHVR